MILSRTYKRHIMLLAAVIFCGQLKASAVGSASEQYTSEDKHYDLILSGQQYVLESQLQELPSKVIHPLVLSKFQEYTNLRYTDYTYSLVGSDLNKPDHYFNWKNWNIIKKKGDGGVDVTGAPNTVLVEGANSTLFNVTPGSLLRLSIAIPAEGFVTFDWSNIGGSNILPQVFHNDKALVVRNNSIMSSLLLPGDTVTINLHNSSNDSYGAISITNFEFFTNAISIINRNWVATDGQGNSGNFSQLISIHQPSITDVVFPKNVDGLTTQPSATGYPVIDKDKDLTTLDDQYSLNDMEGFEMSWYDETFHIDDTTTIIRHWLIKDTQLNNTMENSQIIKIANPSSFLNAPMSEYEDLLDQKFTSVTEDKSLEEHVSYSTTTCIYMQVLSLYSQVL